MRKAARVPLTDFAALPEAPPPAAPAAARARLELPAAPAPTLDRVEENAKRKGITTRMQPAQIKRFRMLSAELDMTEQDLVMIGLNLLFERLGQTKLAPELATPTLEQ